MSRATANKPARIANRLRIIGGRWRGVRIDFPPIAAIRPSPDRVRETLFNWLQHEIGNASCLDLFAGSGALGIEALSRGAGHVTFVDREARATRHLSSTLERLGTKDAEVITSDASRYLQHPTRKFDVVFLDPPFASGLLHQTFALLASGWLNAGAFIYVECPSEDPLAALPSGWAVYRSKRAGQVGYHLLRAVAASVEKAE